MDTTPAEATCEHPEATTVLVLGILGLAIPMLAPIAWAKGNRVVAEIDAADPPFTNRRSATTGRTCGIAVTLLWTAVIVVSLTVIVVVLGERSASAGGAAG